MSWLARLRNVLRADRVSAEIDREMAFHLAERVDELVAAGASPEEARREAQRRFGSSLAHRESTRERDLLVWLETLMKASSSRWPGRRWERRSRGTGRAGWSRSSATRTWAPG